MGLKRDIFKLRVSLGYANGRVRVTSSVRCELSLVWKSGSHRIEFRGRDDFKVMVSSSF